MTLVAVSRQQTRPFERPAAADVTEFPTSTGKLVGWSGGRGLKIYGPEALNEDSGSTSTPGPSIAI